MREISIGKNEAGKRMDKLIEKILKNSSKSFIYKMLRKKNITLNGKKAQGNELLNEKDVIRIYFSDETFEKLSGGSESSEKSEKNFKAYAAGMADSYTAPKIRDKDYDNFVKRIIFEDDDILIANKPANMLSQKAYQNDISMNDILIEYMLKTGKLTEVEMLTFTPAFVNRLDRNTSGIMVAGKSYKGLRTMSELIKDRTVEKYYYVLVWGKPKSEAHLEAYLTKDENSNQVTVTEMEKENSVKIITEYEKIWQVENVAMLKVHLITGKTHQIRAHLAFEGFPVIGDLKYGSKKINTMFKKEFGVNRQMLHSCQLSFPETIEGNMAGRTFTTPVPEIFTRIKEEYSARKKV